MKTLLIFFCVLGVVPAWAQLDFMAIPDSLLEGSNQVVLEDHTHYSVLSREKASLERNYRVWLLNPSAIADNAIQLPYDSFSKINKAKVIVKDRVGRELQTWSLKDFDDWKAGWSEMATDSRMKTLSIPAFTLPFSIEVAYELEYKGSLFYPVWTPISEEKQSLVGATFTVTNQTDDPVRYLGYRLDEPDVHSDGGSTEYRWSVAHIKGFEDEPYSGDLADYAPVLYTAPSAFEMDGFEGDMRTWQSFGDWIRQLNTGMDDFSEAQKTTFQIMVAGLESDREKVEAVYNFLQENMRYVSIQLGIGGWRPFPASFVHEKKYGDCKALTFYAKSMLDALEIPAYYTLVRAGAHSQGFIREDFPCASFNHAFLTVLLDSDTIWLECTSQNSPFGYLGSFTSDRNVLLIDNEGGHLIHSRAYSLAENRQSTRSKLRVGADGISSLQLDRTYTGLEIENEGFFGLISATSLERENWLYDHLECGIQQIENFQLKPLLDEVVPETGFTLDAQVSGLAKINSNRIFLQWDALLFPRYGALPDIRRQGPLVVRYPFTTIDSLEVNIPAGYVPESIPEEVHLDTPFGSYHREIQALEAGSFLLIRKLERYKGTFPVSDYPAFREFIQAIRKSDQKRMVWKKGN